MKKLILISLLILLCISCEKENILKANLLKEVNLYRKENIINNLLQESAEFYSKAHYLIHFDKIKNDTIITITLEPIGIEKNNTKDNIYGVYEGNIIIQDTQNIGIKYYKKTKMKLNDYETDIKFISDLQYPLWIYKLKNDSLIVIDKVGENI